MALLVVGVLLIPLGLFVGRRRPTRLIGQASAELGIALTTGALVGLAVLFAAEDLERARESRDLRRDNLRFVREVALEPASDDALRPFRYFDLRGQVVAGFDLSNADLTTADLADADLSSSNLRGAFLPSSNLQGANLTVTDFRDANLGQANLSGADLTGTNLRGANLHDAVLDGVDLSQACWDDTTVWSDGAKPSVAPNCGLWDDILTD